MKQFLLFAITLTLLTACGSKETQSESSNNLNKEETNPETDIRKYAITVHGISFRTDDYQNWRNVYKEKTNDLEMLGIYQSLEEEDVFVIFERNDGHDKAKRYLDSRNFKNLLKDMGSKLDQVLYYNIEGQIRGEVTIPYAVGITYTINDWEKWSANWEKLLEELTSNGLELVGKGKIAGSRNLYATWFAVQDLAAVQSNLESYENERSSIPEFGVRSTNISWWKTRDRRK